MARAMLAVLLAFAPMVTASPETAAMSCSSHTSRVTPPKYIYVFRSHRRGSSIPARVERWPFKNYVGAVMRSGAWPNRVRESAKAGAIAIKQWAWWMVLHHQAGYSWHGRCYSVRDGDQYLRPAYRPGQHVPMRTAAAVRATWAVSLRKHGRFFRTGWSGGSYNDGWHLGEDSVRAAAERGWGWRRIIRHYLSPVRIVEG